MKFLVTCANYSGYFYRNNDKEVAISNIQLFIKEYRLQAYNPKIELIENNDTDSYKYYAVCVIEFNTLEEIINFSLSMKHDIIIDPSTEITKYYGNYTELTIHDNWIE